MRNFKFEIVESQLIIKVNLDEEHGLSKSGRSIIVGCSEGNFRLFDRDGPREEFVNLTVHKRAPRDDAGDQDGDAVV